MKPKVILFVFSFLIVSCKQENNSVDQEAAKSQPEMKELIIDFSFKTNVEDQFAILLNDIKIDEFQSKNVHIRETVYPSSEMERIHAKFNPDNLSVKLLITLGKNLKEVFFESLKFKYGKNSIIINSDNFEEYLMTNDYLKFDKENSLLKAILIRDYTDPVIILKQKLLDFLAKD